MQENYFMYKTVATKADLPMVGVTVGEEYCALDTRYLYRWSGIFWSENGFLQKDTDFEPASQISNDSEVEGDTLADALKNLSDTKMGISCSPENLTGMGMSVSGLPFGEDIAFGTPIYYKNDGKYYPADASDDTKSPVVGLCDGEDISYISQGIDEYAKLLLHGDGVNGSTTIVDSEITPKSVTAVGSAHLELNPKIGSGCAKFNGLTSYLSIPDSADWAFGSGDFTIELCFNLATVGDSAMIYDQWVTGGGGNDHISLQWNANGYLRFYNRLDAGGYNVDFHAPAWTPVANTWYHLAVVRNGNNWYMFVDGVSQSLTLTAGSWSCTLSNLSAPITIGAGVYSGVPYPINGCLDEVRISKGIARWTSSFTPSTIPYTADSYTKLLLHFDGDTLDSETTPKTVTNTAVVISKFAGAIALNGSSDYISLPDSADWNVGSNPFTVDSWVNFSALPTNNYTSILMASWTGGNGGRSMEFGLNYFGGAYKLYLQYSANGTNTTELVSNAVTINTGTWYYLAFVRDGNTLRFFLNGVAVGTASLTGSIYHLSTALTIGGGSSWASSYFLNGYVDEFRFSKGIARWADSFTPPTSAYGTQIPVYTGSMLQNGVITNEAWSLTVGQLVYLAVGGGLTQTSPSDLNNIVQVIGLATSATTILLDIGAVTRLTKFTEIASIFEAGDSFTIEHDADPDYTRFVQVIMQREDVVDVKFSPDTEANFTFDPTAVEFVGDPWWSWCQMKQVYNVPYMVANYVFENDIIHDYTERSHNGTNHGATFIAGIVDKALSLGGSAYVDVANSADFRPVAPGTDFFSVEFWVKPTSTDGTIIGVWNEADNRRSWRIYLEDSHIKMDISEDGTTVAGTWDGGEGQWGSHLTPGYWYHIGFSRHANDEIRFSINGNVTLPHVYPGAGSAYNNTVDALRIGAKGGATPAGYFTGAICELAIYKGLDMTATYQTWTGGRFQADYNLNGMGEHVGSFPLTPVTVKTSSAGRIDTSNWLSIFGMDVDWDINKGTGNLYALLSVDGGTTWLKWADGEWNEVSESTEGTLVEDFPTEKAYWDEMFVAGTLDILIQMTTDSIEATPSLRNVLISTIQNGYQNVDTSKIIYHLISPTETKITNITDLYGQVATRYYNVKGKVSLSLD